MAVALISVLTVREDEAHYNGQVTENFLTFLLLDSLICEIYLHDSYCPLEAAICEILPCATFYIYSLYFRDVQYLY